MTRYSTKQAIAVLVALAMAVTSCGADEVSVEPGTEVQPIGYPAVVGEGCDLQPPSAIMSSDPFEWESANALAGKSTSALEGRIISISGPRATTTSISDDIPLLYFRVMRLQVDSDHTGTVTSGRTVDVVLSGSGIDDLEEQAKRLCYGRDGSNWSEVELREGNSVFVLVAPYNVKVPGVTAETLFTPSGWLGIWRIDGPVATSGTRSLNTGIEELIEAIVAETENGEAATKSLLNDPPIVAEPPLQEAIETPAPAHLIPDDMFNKLPVEVQEQLRPLRDNTDD